MSEQRGLNAGLSRHHFLRGMGVCISLPLLESLSPLRLLAAAPESGKMLATTATGAPLRSLFIFFPNGAIPAARWPTGQGSDFSWRRTARPLESNPGPVFERLFGAGAPGERRASLERRRQEEQSVLDFVLEDARAMQRRLNSEDRRKLDQYLTGVRALEARIQKVEQLGEVK